MTVPVHWTPRARRDLRDILVRLGEQDPAVAVRFKLPFEAKMRRAAVHPRLGRLRPDNAPMIRSLVEVAYLVLYQVLIVHVVDGRRNLEAISRWFRVSPGGTMG